MKGEKNKTIQGVMVTFHILENVPSDVASRKITKALSISLDIENINEFNN